MCTLQQKKRSVLEQRLSLDKEFCDECLFDIDEEIRECWSSNRVSSVCQMVTGDGQHDTSRTCVSGNVFILKIFLICRDKKMGQWRGENTRAGARRLFWWFTFSFQVSDKQPDKRNHRSRGCRLHRSAPSHTVSRYADGEGFSSPLVSINFSCFISSGKAWSRGYASASLNRPLIPARSAKVMQLVTLLHQTGAETGRHCAG